MDLQDAGFLRVEEQNRKVYRAGAQTSTGQQDNESSCGSVELRDIRRSGAHGVDELSLSDLSDERDGDNNNDADRGDVGPTATNKHPVHYRHAEDNQIEDHGFDSDAASRSWSSLSVAASDLSLERSASESLSLSVSTESDPNAAERVLYSSSASDAFQEHSEEDDGDAKSKVLLPETVHLDAAGLPEEQLELAEASSLSGEMSSSSFEVHYIEDEDEEYIYGSDDDDLWGAFDAALRRSIFHYGEGVPINLPRNPVEIAPTSPSVEDDGYDGSASEDGSVSSLDESVHDVLTDEYFYAGVRPEFDRDAIQHDANMDSLSSAARSCAYGSSVSSISSSDPLARLAPEDSSIDSLSDISSGVADGHRWIENIPVVPEVGARVGGTTQPSGDFGFRATERPLVWRENEYVEAHTGRSQSRLLGTWNRNDDSVVLEGEDDDQHDSSWEEDVFNALPRIEPTKPVARVAFDDVSVKDFYVPYTDLAGIIEAHAVRRSGMVLDLGCGTSRVCQELVFHGYNRVIGVDKELSVIAFQRQQPAVTQLHEYLQFLPMDAGKGLLLPDCSCDCILSKATLDAIAARGIRDAFPCELLETLKETIRCLKPGGILLVVGYKGDLMNDGESEPTKSKAERIAVRFMRPWWRWEEVSGLLHRQLTLVQQYAVGQPRMVDGVLTKPYKVLVWRRRETDKQRLQRLLLDIVGVKQQRREYDARIQLCHSKHERATQEQTMIREFRQMVLEDERGRLERAFAGEREAVRVRKERREACYAALLEDERQQMKWEDDAGALRRIVEQEIKMFVVDSLVRDLVIGRAVELAIAKQAEMERTRLETAAIQAAADAKRLQALASTETQAADTAAWIREEVIRIVNIAVGSPGSENATSCAPQPKYSRSAAHALVQSVSTDPVKASVREDESATTAAAVATVVVASILATAVASMTTNDAPSIHELETGTSSGGSETEAIFNVTGEDGDTAAFPKSHEDGDTAVIPELPDAHSKAAAAATAAETVAWIVATAMASLTPEGAPQGKETHAQSEPAQTTRVDTTDVDRSEPTAIRDDHGGRPQVSLQSGQPNSDEMQPLNTREPSETPTTTPIQAPLPAAEPDSTTIQALLETIVTAVVDRNVLD